MVKNVAWHPSTDYSDLVACGFSTGRTLVARIPKEDPSFNVLAEYTPKQPRACNVVAFSNSDPYLLSGLEKVRNDHGLLVWDLNTFVTPLSSRRDFEMNPTIQFGGSEGVSSAAWHCDDTSRILAGMGLKWIRAFDIRNWNKEPVLSISTKAVYGIATDPFSGHLFASFADDGLIRVWDDRRPLEPLLSFNADYRVGIANWKGFFIYQVLVLETFSWVQYLEF